MSFTLHCCSPYLSIKSIALCLRSIYLTPCPAVSWFRAMFHSKSFMKFIQVSVLIFLQVHGLMFLDFHEIYFCFVILGWVSKWPFCPLSFYYQSIWVPWPMHMIISCTTPITKTGQFSLLKRHTLLQLQKTVFPYSYFAL